LWITPVLSPRRLQWLAEQPGIEFVSVEYGRETFPVVIVVFVPHFRPGFGDAVGAIVRAYEE